MKDRLVLGATDSIEKITCDCREYLIQHKWQILSVMKIAGHKEQKWHLAQLIARMNQRSENWLLSGIHLHIGV